MLVTLEEVSEGCRMEGLQNHVCRSLRGGLTGDGPLWGYGSGCNSGKLFGVTDTDEIARDGKVIGIRFAGEMCWQVRRIVEEGGHGGKGADKARKERGG
jgi:hypothetical protein